MGLNRFLTKYLKMELSEEWKDVTDYPGYKISDMGRFKLQNGTISRGKPNDHGYIRVGLRKNSTPEMFHVHVLVAKAFIPNPENKPIVNHINGIRSDNRSVNLEWATYSENNTKKVFPKTPKPKNVIQLDLDNIFIKLWDSAEEAAKSTKLKTSINIKKTCTGHQQNSAGYKWIYLDDIKAKAEGKFSKASLVSLCDVFSKLSVDNDPPIDNDPSEKWVDYVVEDRHIKVSSTGRIEPLINYKTFGCENSGGYMRIKIGNKTYNIHRLVCCAFKPIENPEDFVVDHVDGNRKNNNIANLEWVTSAENTRRSKNLGKSVRPVGQFSLDGKLIAEYNSIIAAADAIGRNQTGIVEVCKNKQNTCGGFIWKYIDKTTNVQKR